VPLGGTVAAGTTPVDLLASSLSPTVATLAAAERARQRGNHQATATRPGPTTPAPKPNVIERLVRVVPEVIWIALAASLALAAMGGAFGLLTERRVRRQAGRIAAVSAEALTDPLTGVPNRRGFTQAVERELARSERYGRTFVLAYVDVRSLKAVNDSEGHLAGDHLLKESARLLKESARAVDVVGRIGGDELGLLLVEQSAEGAETVSERISAEVAARRDAIGIHAPWDLTIGTAAYPEDGETFEELLAAADRRLYEQRGIALSPAPERP
jgi:diguanylate cyclase (GGDEF)-like protein